MFVCSEGNNIANIECALISVFFFFFYTALLSHICRHGNVGLTIKDQLLYGFHLSLNYSFCIRHNNKCIRSQHPLLSYLYTPNLSFTDITGVISRPFNCSSEFLKWLKLPVTTTILQHFHLTQYYIVIRWYIIVLKDDFGVILCFLLYLDCILCDLSLQFYFKQK